VPDDFGCQEANRPTPEHYKARRFKLADRSRRVGCRGAGIDQRRGDVGRQCFGDRDELGPWNRKSLCKPTPTPIDADYRAKLLAESLLAG
jgi:hypothetical protein